MTGRKNKICCNRLNIIIRKSISAGWLCDKIGEIDEKVVFVMEITAMGKSLLDSILDRVVDKTMDALGGKSAVNGKMGEVYTARELKLVKLFGRKGKILRNVYIPKDNGETSEIDVLFITQKGIFVIESKNYSGWIFGSENQYKWTMMLPNKEKHYFYNPIKQNQTHIKCLKNYIGTDIPLFSLIVFSERCELKKVTVENPDIKVIKRDYTYATVRDIWNEKEDKLSNEEIDELYHKLKNLTKVNKDEKEAHIQNIKKKYDKAETDKIQNASESEIKNLKEHLETGREMEAVDKTKYETRNEGEKKICPRCGRELVLRTAKKGANAGKQFYGCSAFPKCRYILNLPEEDFLSDGKTGHSEQIFQTQKTTLQYYNKNAENFINTTRNVDFSEVQTLFLSQLFPGAHILDFGCGSGRDAKYFLNQGYLVDAVDGSEEICKAASEYIGIPVRNMLFQELEEIGECDGIWACSSILHVSKDELPAVLQKMSDALKENGVIYTSFKYGDFEGERNGRYFTDLTEDSFTDLLRNVLNLSIEKFWITGDVRDGRGDERWLNVLMRKISKKM